MVEENGQDVTKLTESSQKTFAEEVEEISENKVIEDDVKFIKFLHLAPEILGGATIS